MELNAAERSSQLPGMALLQLQPRIVTAISVDPFAGRPG